MIDLVYLNFASNNIFTTNSYVRALHSTSDGIRSLVGEVGSSRCVQTYSRESSRGYLNVFGLRKEREREREMVEIFDRLSSRQVRL